MTLYDEIKAAGIEHDHHASDLYLPDTEQVRVILLRYPRDARNAKPFTDNMTGKPWIDVPFAYMPHWAESVS